MSDQRDFFRVFDGYFKSKFKHTASTMRLVDGRHAELPAVKNALKKLTQVIKNV